MLPDPSDVRDEVILLLSKHVKSNYSVKVVQFGTASIVPNIMLLTINFN